MFLIPLFVWVVSQVLKTIFASIRNKSFQASFLLSSGRMPSSHSALMTSVTTLVAMKEGIESMLFVVSFALTCIVLHDALVVRRQVGIHAQIWNEKAMHEKTPSWKNLPTSLGHTFWEVFGGVVLGVFLTLLLWQLWVV